MCPYLLKNKDNATLNHNNTQKVTWTLVWNHTLHVQKVNNENLHKTFSFTDRILASWDFVEVAGFLYGKA